MMFPTDSSNEEYLSEKLLPDSESDNGLPPLQVSHRSLRWTTVAHWTAHLILVIMSGLYILKFTLPSTQKLCIRPTEEIYSDLSSHLEPEYRSMQPLVGPNGEKDESWIGPINAENFWKWDAITTIGVASISDHEQARMGMYTSRANDTGEYFIVPQVFHALHCLKRMREAWWEHGLNITDHDKMHLDHCVDNFRQNLMCTADLSPIPFHWGGDKHRADYNTVRQCRKWDLIAEWAKKRNTTGYVL